uniref:SFRICE_029442 n=1 Tax=Spodoptera frugiperda TaxID=7108 RepID=A0A2H1WGV4_SPOFR
MGSLRKRRVLLPCGVKSASGAYVALDTPLLCLTARGQAKYYFVELVGEASHIGSSLKQEYERGGVKSIRVGYSFLSYPRREEISGERIVVYWEVTVFQDLLEQNRRNMEHIQ